LNPEHFDPNNASLVSVKKPQAKRMTGEEARAEAQIIGWWFDASRCDAMRQRPNWDQAKR
jgi:hypothetical protein